MARPSRQLIRRLNALVCVVAVAGSTTLFAGAGFAPHRPSDQSVSGALQATSKSEPCVLWRDPPDLERRDLFYGPGGQAHQPRSTAFTFIAEDLDGTNPKFAVRDDDGVTWKIKLGTEARPETAASRLVWAVGYSADENYFLPAVQVQGMPGHVHRGRTLIAPDGGMLNVRLKRESDGRKKIGNWQWRADPFTGTRELNGLRVLMAVINNWDLKDVNNGVFRSDDDPSAMAARVYEVSDLGSSFGSAGLERTKRSNGDLDAYRRSRFITRVTDDTVDFEVPRRADWIVLANTPEFVRRLHLRWIGKQIPRQDARWIGQLLARLSPNQIRDAFRAAGYSPLEVEGFASIVEWRIAQLNAL